MSKGIHRHITAAAAAALLLMGAAACTIQPPLHLPEGDIEVNLPEVAVDIEAVWAADTDWRADWHYGWDTGDEALFGSLSYPEPTDWHVRLMPLGDDPDAAYTTIEKLLIQGSSFRRRLAYGYHDILFWNYIYTPDGTQATTFDESDPAAVYASSSGTRIGYMPPAGRGAEVMNNPDPFWSGMERAFYVSRILDDYDYYDPERRVWVMQLTTRACPMAYIYLVQVVVYNNRGRIIGLTDYPAISSLAQGVTLNSGRTSDTEAIVVFPMRMKSGRPTPAGEADIFGGKLTTYGLCGMDSWLKAPDPAYQGSHPSRQNLLSLSMRFVNSTDSVYNYDITRQLQRHCHGGVITVEIDADTIRIPTSANAGSSFNPVVDDPDEEFIDIPF